MVFLHPGGFVLGSGTQDMCAPDFLMTEDIVLVSLNYRLGILGTFRYQFCGNYFGTHRKLPCRIFEL